MLYKLAGIKTNSYLSISAEIKAYVAKGSLMFKIEVTDLKENGKLIYLFICILRSVVLKSCQDKYLKPQNETSVPAQTRKSASAYSLQTNVMHATVRIWFEISISSSETVYTKAIGIMLLWDKISKIKNRIWCFTFESLTAWQILEENFSDARGIQPFSFIVGFPILGC